MGELLLCNHPIAAMPYYMENLAVNIYSLEELCYCMKKNAYFLDDLFEDGELLSWIKGELRMPQLADELDEILRLQGMSQAVVRILRETQYCSREEEQQILASIREMEDKSEFERGKMRADRLMEKKNYISGIMEYRKLLEMEQECRQNQVLCGDIWHDIGTAYARLFLFREAADAYRRALGNNRKRASLEAWMAACWYQGDLEAVEQIAGAYGITEERKRELFDRWTAAGEAVRSLGHIAALLEEENAFAGHGELERIVADYKREYVMNSKL